MKLSKNETIILFIESYEKIMLGDKLAPIKFIFNEDAFSLFKIVISDKTSRYNTNIYKILMIKNNNVIKEDEIYIKIPDADLFFDKLHIVINLYLRYNSNTSMYLLKEFMTNYLWIKMTPYDFLNIYQFLDLQIAFLLNNNYFNYDPFHGSMKVGVIGKYDIYVMTEDNPMMWETYKRMFFKICDKDFNSYELPSIHYGIENNHTCYIYAIQNMAISKQDKKISRYLYKYSNDFVHPGFILSLKLMIDFLIDNGITNIKIPLMEIMNYSFHEFLSNKIKIDFKNQWVDDYIDNVDEDELLEYQKESKTYKKYVDRTDEISKAKVDRLAMTIDKVISYYDNIEMNIEDYMINLKIKEKTKKM